MLRQPNSVGRTQRFGTESPYVQSKTSHSFVRTPPHVRDIAARVEDRRSDKPAKESTDNECSIVGCKSDWDLEDVQEYAAEEEDIFSAVVLRKRG